MKYFFALIILASSLSSYEIIPDKRKLEILSPSLKDQKSAKIRLQNGLEALIISDPDTKKSGAVLTVLVGSWSDPKEHPGMAHFLEHMLFMGTEEYPDESEYQRFIKDHGGEANAFTTDTGTSYMFSIDPEYLSESLSRFSSFFKKPLLNTSQVERELKAIDQEYAKNIENDDIREMFVHKSLMSPKHPAIGFSMGNSATLRNVTPAELREFYEKHYSANLMRLIVVGKEPLDQLEKMVDAKFNTIPDKKIAKYLPDVPLSNPEFEGKLVVIEPVKDIKTLTFIFEIPKKYINQETKPLMIISHILGHEGEGSLLSVLKENDLAETLSASELTSTDTNLELAIEIGLTDKGLEHWQEVTRITFQAIKMIANEKVPAYIFNDLAAIQKVEYQFQTRKDVFQDFLKKGFLLTKEPIDTFPERNTIIEKFDPESVQEIAKGLSIDKAYIYMKAKKEHLPFPPNKKEKWVGAEFGIYPLPKTLTEAILKLKQNSAIRLPANNPFLPTDFAAKPLEADFSTGDLLPIPKAILEDASARIYFAQDSHFHEPKCALSFFIRDKNYDPKNIKSVVLADLYLKALNDQLNPYVYPAQIAGMNFSIKKDDLGFLISVQGYSHTCETLFTLITDTVQSRKLPYNRFNQYKTSLMKEYQNAALNNPVQMSLLLFKAAIYKYYALPNERLEALANITEEDLKKFTETLFSEGYVEGMLVGNLNSKEAEAIAAKAKGVFAKTPLKLLLKREVLDLKNELGPQYIQQDIAASGNAAVLLIESPPPFSHKMRAIHQILTQALEEPFYSELRTKQQTGYIVQAFGEDIERRLINLFFTQSNTHDPRDLLARYELFVEGFLQELTREELTKERFEVIKSAILFELTNPVKNLSQTADLLSNLLFLYNGDFHWLEKRIEAMQKLTYEEAIDGIHAILGRNNLRRFAILLKGKSNGDSHFEYTDAGTLEHFKAEESYSPAP